MTIALKLELSLGDSSGHSMRSKDPAGLEQGKEREKQAGRKTLNRFHPEKVMKLRKINRLAVAIILALVLYPGVINPSFATTYVWDTSTVKTLSQTSHGNPALVYNSGLTKFFIAYTGTDASFGLHILSSTDAVSWSDTALSQTTGGAYGNDIDMTYDSSNGYMYLIYTYCILTFGSGGTSHCNPYIYVSQSNDGSTWTVPVQLAAAPQDASTIASITFNPSNNILLVAVYNIDGTGRTFIYQSKDGGSTWSSLTTLGLSSKGGLELRFLQGSYYLAYVGTANDIPIIQSSDGIAWINVADLSQSTNGRPSLSYNIPEGFFHLSWKGTDLFSSINDIVSSDAKSWKNLNTLSETTIDGPSVAFIPSGGGWLLMSWTATDNNGCSFSCGSINTIQYIVSSVGGGGGGGSVAYGSLITMADGTQVPVQNLKVGDKLLGYDTSAATFAVSTVDSIAVVDASNMLIVHITDGTPFRVDSNPRQTLWVKTRTGSVGWLPVTQVVPGDYLFTVNGWVQVTSIDFAPAGNHVMFDVFASIPYFASGYLDPPHKV